MQKILILLIKLTLLLIGQTIAFNYLLQFDLILEEYLKNTQNSDDIHQFITLKNKWTWLSYSLTPITILFKVAIISSTIYIGAQLAKKKILYRQIMYIVLKAEYIFILVGILKIIWFYFFQTVFTFKDLQYLYPLSALNITGYESINPWFIYPLQVLNLFELAYWFILAFLLGKELKTNMDESFKIVASSYGPALLIWVVAVMFFTLNYS